MSKNKLEIEDSREFKFEDFDPNGYDFNKEESFWFINNINYGYK